MPSSHIKPGIIKLGNMRVPLFPNVGITLDNRGVIIFKGRCSIGNNSFLSIGNCGKLVFEDNFSCTSTLRLACCSSISFKRNVLVGFDCFIMDSDFHTLTRLDGSKTRGFGSISVGEGVWIGCGCKILKNSAIPPKVIVAAGTIIHSIVEAKPYSIIGNRQPVSVLSYGYYLNPCNNQPDYEIKQTYKKQ